MRLALSRVESKKSKTRPSAELRVDTDGVVAVDELFHMRIGVLRLRQRWLEREVSPSLTAAAAAGLAAAGFALGVLAASQWLGSSVGIVVM